MSDREAFWLTVAETMVRRGNCDALDELVDQAGGELREEVRLLLLAVAECCGEAAEEQPAEPRRQVAPPRAYKGNRYRLTTEAQREAHLPICKIAHRLHHMAAEIAELPDGHDATWGRLLETAGELVETARSTFAARRGGEWARPRLLSFPPPAS